MKWLTRFTTILFFLSLNVSAQNQKVKESSEISISLTKQECGSYEVRNNGVLLGYVVKPFWFEIQKKNENQVRKFEELIRTRYSSHYNKFYRVYWFITDNASDTLLNVEMLISKQVRSIPNWQCEEKDVETYNRGSRHNKRYPEFILYNCTKDRFKMAGDADW